MDLLALVDRVIPFLAGYALPFVLVLGLLVFVHEFGHYYVARLNKVRVEVFSIGFGPELFGWHDRAGTRWKVGALPLGGYVKMFGDADASSAGPNDAAATMTADERAVSFHHKRVGQRAAVVAAGPAANFLFAILALAVVFVGWGQPFTQPVASHVAPGSAAEAAGIAPGDRVLSVDGTAISRFEELQRIVVARPGEALRLEVDRGGQTLTLTATPRPTEVTDRFGGVQRVGQLGLRSEARGYRELGPFEAVVAATGETWSIVVQTLRAVGQMITGARGAEELGGVLRIGEMSGAVVQEGRIDGILWFMAVLSINLGLINLFPIPVLDGGHLVFYAAEAVRGRPLPPRVQEWGAMAGLTAVVALMLFATWNDIVHFAS